MRTQAMDKLPWLLAAPPPPGFISSYFTVKYITKTRKVKWRRGGFSRLRRERAWRWVGAGPGTIYFYYFNMYNGPAICWSTRHALMALLSSVLCCAVLCTTENSRVSMVLLLLLLLFSAIYDRPFILLFLKKKREPKNVKKKIKSSGWKGSRVISFFCFSSPVAQVRHETTGRDTTRRDAKSHLNINEEAKKKKKKKEKTRGERRLRWCNWVHRSVCDIVVTGSSASAKQEEHHYVWARERA